MKIINIIIPCFNEVLSIDNFHKELTYSLSELKDYNFHITYVNDGSTDGTNEFLEKLVKKEEKFHVKLVNFSRNFGKEKALTAGLNISEDYDATICIDADLQHPPSKINELIKEWENGFEVVCAIRSSIEQPRKIKKFFSNLFYFFMKKFSTVQLDKNSTDFGLYSKKVVKNFNLLKEKQRIFRGLISWTGFKRKNIYFTAIKDQKKKCHIHFQNYFY